VNLSARQFTQADLAAQVKAALDESRLQPRFLELEITETSVMDDVEKTARILRELKTSAPHRDRRFRNGILLSQLSEGLPVDTLKLDRSFVRDLIAPQDAKIVSGVIAMAHSMSLQVMAEGSRPSVSSTSFARTTATSCRGFSSAAPPARLSRPLHEHHKAWRGIA